VALTRNTYPEGQGRAGSASQCLLVVDDVSVRFGAVSALSGVSLAVGAPAVVGLIGPNGAGKTTLFDAISGIRTPSAGRIEFLGNDITRSTATTRARLGMRRTFQRQQPFASLSVEDNILVALEGRGGSVIGDLVAFPVGRARERLRRERVREVMDRCGITKVKHEPAARLPIGLIRMVEFGRAIVANPHLLLLDEPTSGLDHPEIERLGNVIRETREKDGCAVMLVEHDVPFVMSLCDRIVVLNLGNVLVDDVPSAIRSDPKVQAAYLGGSDC
jgi:branched-chain amino acid transport system ATP-binding protein